MLRMHRCRAELMTRCETGLRTLQLTRSNSAKRWISLPILAGWERVFWERESKRYRLAALLQVVSMPLPTVSIGKRATKLCVIWTIIRLTFIRGSILREEELNPCCFKLPDSAKSLRKLLRTH